VLSELGQAAVVLVAVAVALEEVLEAAAFAPEALTKPEVEEMAEEEDEEPVFEEEADETAALSPRLMREPVKTLLLDETGLPI
jgi:hypothetical protein